MLAALLSQEGPVGSLALTFTNSATSGQRFGVSAGTTVTLALYESANAKTWTKVGDDIVVAPGGVSQVSAVSKKPYLSIRACGGGSVRCDISHRGMPFTGQITLGLHGKRGLSKDYSGNSASTAFAHEPAPATWPE